MSIVVDDIHRVLRNAFPPYGDLQPGQAIQIRKADYLDTKAPGERQYGHLRSIKGGKT